ncbi:hypothetical protein [Actinokineospora enzanensis]|uniref:hypothetical protein n=1 Tax=Actinokineospora enzanensis TaxID=155975 RepID=UPI00036028D8|nr:hypothetical protein [Actinokineospora enzanensis]
MTSATLPAYLVQEGRRVAVLDPDTGEYRPLCRACQDQIHGASFLGRCHRCHNHSLVDIGEEGETWGDVFIGTNLD